MGADDAMVHEPLTPQSLGLLADRIHREWTSRRRIFDLPTSRFFDVSAGPDLTAEFLGREIATPLGPAAGPHTQLAQNLVLGWLGGGRLFELKTVQVLDELDIPRPCIDVAGVGYNIEWSQELQIPRSLEEYVKGRFLIELLTAWGELDPFLGDPGAHVFDLSVGYDLAGIASPGVAAFIDSIADASTVIDRLRPELLGGPFAHLADIELDPCIADTVTLSTFHGCPPDEIEKITKHLMTRHGLDVIVKLNPTLLGFGQVRALLDALGYGDLRIRPEDFAADLRFERGLELIGGLSEFATEAGRRFGIKLTNTLVVENDRGVLPSDTMYLSGEPLHVLAMTLLDQLHISAPGMLRVGGHDGPVQVSWSAGIDKENLADAVGLGIVPATVCSDLLRPGGYGRLAPMLTTLGRTIDESGGSSLREFVDFRSAEAFNDGARDSLAVYTAQLHDPVTGARYRADATTGPLREVDHDLEMWGCVACNLCVTVCPNDAVMKLPSPESLGHRWEYVVLSELCNDCGNCNTFCPERGDPARIKPRLFTSPHRFEADTGQAFLIGMADGVPSITARTGWESETATLAETLGGPDGLPIATERPEAVIDEARRHARRAD